MTSANEILFLLQVACIIIVCWGCQLLGRSALVSWLCLQGVLANILVLKLVRLFQLEVTITDAFSIGSLYCVNILRARYGKRAAQEGVATAFLLSMSTALFLTLHNQFAAIEGGQIILCMTNFLSTLYLLCVFQQLFLALFRY